MCGAPLQNLIDRRGLLSLMLAVLRPSPAAAQSPADHALGALLDDYVLYAFERHPEWVTMLGLDHGRFAQAKWHLDDRSVEQLRRDRDVVARQQQQQLTAIDRARLSTRSAIHYDIYQYQLIRERAVLQWRGFGRPYVIDQFDYGSYLNIPRLLASQQAVKTEEDANAWLARLQAFPKVLDQELECVRFDAAQGIIPPDFIIDVTVGQIEELSQAPAVDSFVVKSLAARTAKHGITGDHSRVAARVWDNAIRPALRRQVEALQALRALATSEPGIWRLPDGDALYSALLRYETTTAMSAADIHALGLQMVAEISGRMDELMRKLGMEHGSVAQRLRSMFEGPRFRYPTDESGRERILRDAYGIVERARTYLPSSFRTVPRAEFTIQRMPAHLEAGAAGALYDPPSLDGSRPGVLWINLGDPADTSSFVLPTILHHEGLPGHHLQFSLAYEATDLPLALKLWDFTAYTEGWAMYAEQLADEWGVYDDEP
jgi:uncharacterized protein (DUF885 family)